MIRNCEYCGRLHTGEYGSGRFCSKECARGFSTKAKRKEINKRVSYSIKNKYASDPLLREKTAAGRRKAIENIKLAKRRRLVRINGVDLDITYGELEEYRKTHPVCEICGREEVRRASNKKSSGNNRLSIDHDHNSGHFRGLLCSKCNYNLGWLEGERDKIEEYLLRSR